MADLVIERCLPSERAGEIQALFCRAGHPEFATVYERVYRVRERLGLRSWLGRLEDRVVLHISVSLESFTDGTRTLSCGLLADLMADESHRDFWGPIKLARRMVGDLRKDRTADFLLTSYLPVAEGVFRAAGFKPFNTMRRYILPLVWPYPLLRRLQHGESRPQLTALPFEDGRVGEFLAGLNSPGCFRPVTSEAYFTTRMPRLEYPAGTWLLLGERESPDAVVLVSPKAPGEVIIADVLWRDATPRLTGAFSAVARWASREKHRRLTLIAVEGSPVAVAAQRAGFLERPGAYPVMMLPIGPADAIPAPQQWSLTPFALTAW
jgi:hypothetical protein